MNCGNACKIILGDISANDAFKGSFRNMTIFAGCLTDNEAISYYKAGLEDVYELTEEFKAKDMAGLISNEHFYLGLVGIYDVDNINIINCVIKHNGNTYSIS